MSSESTQRRDFLKTVPLLAAGAISLMFSNHVEALSGNEIDFLATHEIKRGDITKPNILMTYDDWPSHPEELHSLLSAYKEAGQKTTFFFLGENLKWLVEGKYKDYGWKMEDLSEIVKDGHEIACHGWQHETPMTMLSNAKLRTQIAQSLEIMKEVFPDTNVDFFRTPFGSVDDRVRLIGAEFGLQHVKWNVESGGIDKRTMEYVLKGVDKQGNGSIVLSHMQRDFDVSQAKEILNSLTERGYSMVGLSKGISPEDRRLSYNNVKSRLDFRSIDKKIGY